MSSCVVHWDLENQPLPAGSSVPLLCTKIIDVAREHYQHILDLYCYYDSKNAKNHRIKELSMMGFDTIDCRSGKSNEVDMRIVVRALKPRPPNVPQPAIVLISGDGDYAYAMSSLRNAEIPTLLLYDTDNMNKVNTTLIEIAPKSIGISFSGSKTQLEPDEQDEEAFLLAIERSPEMTDRWHSSTTVGELFHKFVSKPTTITDFRRVKQQLLKKNLIEVDKKRDWIRKVEPVEKK